ncbi:MAG: hypothetical protein AB1760_05985 [Pseudomonadota bacterium]
MRHSLSRLLAAAATLALLGAASVANAQSDPFGALYGAAPGAPPPPDASSGRSGATSVSGAVGRSYANAQTGGAVSLAQLDLMPLDPPPMPVVLQAQSARYLKNRPRLAVAGYTLAFVPGAPASPDAGGSGTEWNQRRTQIATRLVGLDDAAARALADEAYADLVAQLEAAGFDVLTPAEIRNAAALSGLARHDAPVGGKGVIDSRATKAWVAYGPEVLPPIKGHAFEQGFGVMAGPAATMAFGRASRDLDAIFIMPRLLIDHIDMESSGNAVYRGSASVDAELKFGLSRLSQVDVIWGNNSGGAMPGWFTMKGAYTPQPFGILTQTADRSDSVALHNALVSVGFNSAYRQSLVYDVEVSPRRFAALTRSAFRGFNAALVAEIRKARGS